MTNTLVKTNEKIQVRMSYFGKYDVIATKVLYVCTINGREKIKHGGNEYFVDKLEDGTYSVYA